MSLVTRNSVHADGVHKTWQERLRDAEIQLAPLLDRLLAKRIVFLVDDSADAVNAFAFGLQHDLDFGILEAHRLSPELSQRLDELGLARVSVRDGSIEGFEVAESRQPGRISVMTSGTTGTVKAIDHSWQTLNTLVRVKENPQRFWFVPYQPGSYAWYQMLCLGAFTPGQDLYCGSSSEPVESFAEALKAGVTAVSSTPTFWRYAFFNIDDALVCNARLETISLGGEIVDQAILDQLRTAFPEASIRHIYASSEAGAAIVVADGQAGFPVSRLNQDDGSTLQVKVEDGRLYIRSPFTTAAAAGKAADWVDTGDLVEIRGDRVYFLGREESSMINVGGMKAFPSEIEAQLLKHPNVLWAQVYARKSPLTGSLPAARVVLRQPPADPEREQAELAAFLRESLPEHAVPRFWTFEQEMHLKASLKS
jgi:acyl-coenzyme A synthetase/AMP-(fatty) acid ligase